MKLVWVVVVVVGVSGCAQGPSAFKNDDKEPFVAEHNRIRATAVPAPDPALPDLVWDDSVASVAQAWSAGCKFEHSHGSLGENLAFFSGDESTPADTVTSWASEISDYDYDSNTCADGAQCGHYTQIVWRDTQKVGCGASTCHIDGFDGTYWVCNYDPPGNFIGEKPY
jgi:pathogenesis-related protein 1